jgi:hypothetical protein
MHKAICVIFRLVVSACLIAMASNADAAAPRSALEDRYIAADEVFVSALANGKVYIAHGSIEREVKIPACIAIRAGFNKKAEDADESLRFDRIGKRAYDRLGDLRQQGEDAYKRCFTRRAPRQPSFAEATKQAQALLAAAVGR